MYYLRLKISKYFFHCKNYNALICALAYKTLIVAQNLVKPNNIGPNKSENTMDRFNISNINSNNFITFTFTG